MAVKVKYLFSSAESIDLCQIQKYLLYILCSFSFFTYDAILEYSANQCCHAEVALVDFIQRKRACAACTDTSASALTVNYTEHNMLDY